MPIWAEYSEAVEVGRVDDELATEEDPSCLRAWTLLSWRLDILCGLLPPGPRGTTGAIWHR